MAIVERQFVVRPRRLVAVRIKAARAVQTWLKEIQQLACRSVTPPDASPHRLIERRLVGQLAAVSAISDGVPYRRPAGQLGGVLSADVEWRLAA